MPKSPPKLHRQRNRRGHGERLRQDIIAAAAELLNDLGELTLRGVAKKVGIAATSVYLHFPDVEHLALAVAELRFADLAGQQAAIESQLSSPAEMLLARCRAYGHFALENPAQYRIMFMADLGSTMSSTFERAPGRAAFDELVAAIKRCQADGSIAADRDAFRLATLVWAAEHGLVSLRLIRSGFPWPPLDDLVDEALARLVGWSVDPAPTGSP